MGFSTTVSFPKGDPRILMTKVKSAMYTGLLRGVTIISDAMVKSAKQNLTDSGKVDRGEARASIDRQVTGYPSYVEGITFCAAEHGRWIEFGRKGLKSNPAGTSSASANAAWPPVDKIREWVRRHNKLFAVSGRTKSGRVRKARAADVNRVAYLIGRKIAERGIDPSPFMEPALAKHQGSVNRVLGEQVAAAIKRA